MGKTIRFNENGLIAIKNKLNEITAGGDKAVSPNDVVTLWHGTDIPGILGILKSGSICAKDGVQHGETYGLNWFSLRKVDNFCKGIVFSIDVPSVEFKSKFKMMNSAEAVARDDRLDVSQYSLKIERFCDFGREQLNRYYTLLIEKGEHFPIETIRDNIFYEWCERSENEDVYMRTSDYDFGLIMANMLGEDKVRAEGFLEENTKLNEAAPEVDEYTIGGEEEDGDNVAGGNYFHVAESIDFDNNGMSINDRKILGKYNLKDLILSKTGNYVTLNKIIANELGRGNGSRFMEELIKMADDNGWILALTPDTSFGGTSVGRLKNFYKRFGFKPNKGRNTDFNTRESMVRKPLNENKYDDLFNKVINDLENFRKQGAEKYGEQNWYAFSWMKKMHPDIEIDPNDIKIYNALLKKYEEVTKLWNVEDEAETVSQQAEETNYDVISLAIEQYGTTSNLGQAGYILPDGSLLNFGSNGYREENHRGIEVIYKKNNIPIWSNEYRYNYVVDFMNHGAIRCCVNSGILDMTKEPTKEQYFTIRAFVRKACDVDIDFTNDKGDTQHSVSYSDAKPQQVVADIYKYYNEGIKPQGNVQFESKDNKKIIIPENKLGVIKENIEPEIASSEVDLSSFKKRDTLPPGIWKDEDTLDSRVRLKLLDIADDFWEFINLSWVEPKGIIITGSICNFNWSKFSDIDLHIIADFREIDEKTEFVKQYLDSKKNEWNNEHEELKIMGFPVELYVQDVDDDIEAGGIYDLEENAWVRKPNPHSIKSIGLNKFSIKDKAAEIMTIIDDMYGKLSTTTDGHDVNQIGEDAHYLWDKVKDLRKKSLNKNGESGSGNIVYKVLRRTGYLDKLFKLFSTVYDRTNSISESMKKYLTVLKEEVAIDGSSEDNPYEKRWKAEREALKSFVANYGKLMQSKEDNKGGKLYKVYFDETMSSLIGYNYCICVQWNEQEMKPGSTVYIRALDKFTPFIRRDLQFDTRGFDNQRGTADDIAY